MQLKKTAHRGNAKLIVGGDSFSSDDRKGLALSDNWLRHQYKF